MSVQLLQNIKKGQKGFINQLVLELCRDRLKSQASIGTVLGVSSELGYLGLALHASDITLEPCPLP